VIEVNGEELTRYTLTPRDVGVEPADRAGEDAALLAGGSPERNAEVTRSILRGEPGPRSDLAAINAGAAIYAAGATDSIAEGVQAARAALADGTAADTLERFVQASQRHAPASAAR
jgi:anthranilate phosphoribosyltransferase